MNLQIGLLEVGIALAVLAGACGATWFAADAHYSQALASLEGQLEGASKAQKTAVNQQIAMDQDAAKEVDSEAKQQIGSMAGVIGDLSMRLGTRGHTATLCPASASAPVPRVQPERPTAAGSGSAHPATPAANPGPATVGPAGIDLGALSDALEIGTESIKAELLWREWARHIGETK